MKKPTTKGRGGRSLHHRQPKLPILLHLGLPRARDNPSKTRERNGVKKGEGPEGGKERWPADGRALELGS